MERNQDHSMGLQEEDSLARTLWVKDMEAPLAAEICTAGPGTMLLGACMDLLH